MVDFLLLGPNGYFGVNFVKYLTAQKKNFETSSVRIDDRAALLDELDRVKPKHVICAAGIAGKPNIDWCETHKQETILVNVTGALNVFDACFVRGIHVSYTGSGIIYQYDEAHPLGSGKGFTEEDAPNFDLNFYVKMRIYLEKFVPFYPNVLYCRILYPISDDFHPGSIPARLVKYKKIIDTPISYTVVDDIWPVIIDMTEKGLTGVYNTANPGVFTNDDILKLYKKYVDPSHEWTLLTPEEKKEYLKFPRQACELDVSKLLTEYPKLDHVSVAVDKVFQRIGERKKNETN